MPGSHRATLCLKTPPKCRVRFRDNITNTLPPLKCLYLWWLWQFRITHRWGCPSFNSQFKCPSTTKVHFPTLDVAKIACNNRIAIIVDALTYKCTRLCLSTFLHNIILAVLWHTTSKRVCLIKKEGITRKSVWIRTKLSTYLIAFNRIKA
jgi:hypothetical protein